MNNLGLVRVGTAVPDLKIANTEYNTEQIIAQIADAAEKKAGFLVFPELAVTGATCGDLFYQEFLYRNQLAGIEKITEATAGTSTVVVLGCYLRLENNLYNCALFIQNGEIKGAVPKMFPAADKRWFAGGADLANAYETIRLLGKDVPFGHLLLTDYEADLTVGAEVADDLWMPVTPGSQVALNGAQIIFNTSASNDVVGKADYRRKMVEMQSAKSNCAYVYTSAGVKESTTDFAFTGHCLVAENGSVIAESPRFAREAAVYYTEIDFQRIRFEATHNGNLNTCAAAFGERAKFMEVELDPLNLIADTDKLYRYYTKEPFTPEDPAQLAANCSEIFELQAVGLAKRIEHTHSKKSVVGISGGLDSTLALLATAYTHKIIGKPASDIVAITMPGFGTTGKTYNNALTIMKLLGAEVREISIKDAVRQHFADIGHDESVHDVTYENSQARERTQILMDVANKEGGMVIGTGDLSEMALGWCTYNGDHMSNYGVNASIPKTLVRSVVKWVMENKLSGPNEDPTFSSDNALLKATLQDILDTPISPELLPPDPNGDIAQKTEESVGPYVLHDFFIYYTMRYGMTPEKLLFIAKNAFEGEYDEEFIQKWMNTFYRRFFIQQFKRTCVPDGPKIGSVGFSPRGDWAMPCDADFSNWLR